MAGNTGKMTADAVRARGPRMSLIQTRAGFVIARDGSLPFSVYPDFSTLAKSYSLRYLLNVGRGMMMEAPSVARPMTGDQAEAAGRAWYEEVARDV